MQRDLRKRGGLRELADLSGCCGGGQMSSHEEMNGGSIPMHFRVNTEGISDEAQQAVVDSIRVVPNFPKPGLFFKDLSLLLGKPAAFGSTIDALVHNVAAVVGIECRGFCFAAPVAIALKVPFVPFRKPGKLPCEWSGMLSSSVYVLQVPRSLSLRARSLTTPLSRLEMHEDALTAGSKVGGRREGEEGREEETGGWGGFGAAWEVVKGSCRFLSSTICWEQGRRCSGPVNSCARTGATTKRLMVNSGGESRGDRRRVRVHSGSEGAGGSCGIPRLSFAPADEDDAASETKYFHFDRRR
eukprot:758936-Hanusia_phi.AAC.3